MTDIQVDTLTFSFHATIAAEQFDKWQHYNRAGRSDNQPKAVDVVALETQPASDQTKPLGSILWLIEAKDFRVISYPPRASNVSGLPQTVADKVSNTVTELGDTAVNASVAGEKSHAAAALAAQVKRIVLHLEPHTGAHTALFPVNFSASVLQRLRQLVQNVDPNPLVLNIANTSAAGVPWAVT